MNQNTASLDSFVRSAIAQACEIADAQVTPGTPLQDLQIDSLRMVAIVGKVEQEFTTTFTPDAILEFFLAEQVADLVGLMREQLS